MTRTIQQGVYSKKPMSEIAKLCSGKPMFIVFKRINTSTKRLISLLKTNKFGKKSGFENRTFWSSLNN